MEDNLTKKDRKDIEKDLDKMMQDLDTTENPHSCFGKPITEEEKPLIRQALEHGLTQLKIENKNKYTPKKDKKE